MKSWTLTVPAEAGQLSTRPVVWMGSGAPKTSELENLLRLDLNPDHLADMASQFIRNVPTKSLSVLLSYLSCCYSRNTTTGKIDLHSLHSIPITSKKIVCGYIFRKGDIVWNCRQCASDGTCVQCDNCFKNSDHTGHEVYFHKASGNGGCCDCGDTEAWAICGNCTEHGANTCNSSKVDPLISFPDALKQGLEVVVAAAVGTIVCYLTCYVRGLQSWGSNEYINNTTVWPANTTYLTARLHNDDVHSYSDVTGALTHVGLTAAEATALTEAVDHVGLATVALKELANSNKLRAMYRQFHEVSGLLFSVMPVDIAAIEPNISAALSWLLSVGNLHPGCCRIVALALAKNVTDLPMSSSACDYSRNCADPHLCTVATIFDADEQFPAVVHQLESPPLRNGDWTKKTINQFVLSSDSVRLNPDELHLMGNAASEPPVQFDSNRCARPFEYCHRNSLSVIILASPFLSKQLKKTINDLIIVFQYDDIFRMMFAQSLTALYPSLSTLYIRSVGTSECCVFDTSVQIYSSNLVVAYLSSDYVIDQSLPMRHPNNLPIARTLTSCLLLLMADMGCTMERRDDSFLRSEALRKRRYGHVLSDLRHVTCRCSYSNLLLLLGQRDSGFLDDVIFVCALLQGIDSFQRNTRSHVEQDNDLWILAAKFVLEMQSMTSTTLITAFCPVKSASTAPPTSLDLEPLREQALLVVLWKSLCAINKYCEPPAIKGCTGWMKYEAVVGHALCCLSPSPSNNSSLSPCLGSTVSKDMLSAHIPLHRLLAKAFACAAMGGQSLLSALGFLQNHAQGLVALADGALKCLSLMAQVQVGMWKRNGSAVSNLLFNYCNVPLCASLRDMDIAAVQVAMLGLGPDETLLYTIHRFEVLELISQEQEQLTCGLGAEYHLPVLAELLRVIIHLCTMVPVNYCKAIVAIGSADCNSIRTNNLKHAIAREVVHLLLAGEQSMTRLETIKDVFAGGEEHVSDELIRSVVHDMCEETAGGRLLGELKEIAYLQFDPEYFHLTSSGAQKAIERVNAHRIKALPLKKKGIEAAIPLISPSSLAEPHHDLLCLRNLLFRPLMFTLLAGSLRQCLDPARGASSSSVIHRVIHVATLQLHCQDAATKCVAVGQVDAWAGAEHFYSTCFEMSTGDTAVGYGCQFLKLLGDIWTAGLVRDDPMYNSALFWVLQQFSERSNSANELLVTQGISMRAAPPSLVKTANKSSKKRSDVQKRTLEQMNERAKQFAMTMGEDNDDDTPDQDQSEDPTRSAARCPEDLDSLEHGASECIYCLEKTRSPIGYLCHAQRSNLVGNMIANDSNSVLQQVFRVVAMSGCAVHQDSSESSPVLMQLAQGDHIVVGKAANHWYDVKSHVGRGWVQRYKCTPQSEGCAPSTIPILMPVSELQFRRHGKGRYHVSSCGHCVHLTCWEKVKAQQLAKGRYYGASAGIVCPLCACTANRILPHVSQSMAVVLDSQPQPSSINSTLACCALTFCSSFVHNQDNRLVDSHCSWSACGYSLLCLVNTLRWNISSLSTEIIDKDLHFMCQMLMTQRLASVGPLSDCIKHILLGQPTPLVQANHLLNYRMVDAQQCSKQECVSAFLDLSLHCVDSYQVPDIFTRNRIIGLCAQRAELELTHKIVDLQYVHVPLLSQDLHMFAVAAVSCQTQWGDKSGDDVMHELGLARLVQILLEPSSTGLAQVTTDADADASASAGKQPGVTSAEEDAAHALVALRSLAAQQAGVPLCSRGCPNHMQLLDIVVTAWLPFMEYLSTLRYCLHRAMGANPQLPHLGLIDVSHFQHLESLLLSLCPAQETLPAVLSSAHSSACCTAWCAHYRRFYGKCESEEGEEVIWIPSVSAESLNCTVESAGAAEDHVADLPTVGGDRVQQSEASDDDDDDGDDDDDDEDQGDDVEDVEEDIYDYDGNDDEDDHDDEIVGHDAVMQNELYDGPMMEGDSDHAIGNEAAALEREDMLQQLLELMESEVTPEAASQANGLLALLQQENFAFTGSSRHSTGDAPATAQISSTSSAGALPGEWTKYGVFPEYSTIDETPVDSWIHSFATRTPLQGSFTGTEQVFGVNGEQLGHGFNDVSHFGLQIKHIAKLVDLPNSYTDLYNMVKFPEGAEGVVVEEPALCLVCGQVLNAGNRADMRKAPSRSNAGECSLHTDKCGSGTGIFYLAQMCSILLTKDGGDACSWPSIYVDDNGEVAQHSRGHHKPLHLCLKSVSRLQLMYQRHQIAAEVTRQRNSSDKIIRQYFY